MRGEFYIFFVIGPINSDHWTWLEGSYNTRGTYPTIKGESGGRPGGRYYSSSGSIGETLYIFGGDGFGDSAAGKK